MEAPTQHDMQTRLGISQTYASMILRGVRTPSRPLAIRMFREFGWKHPVIAELTEEDMATFERIEPWIPTSDRQDAA